MTGRSSFAPPFQLCNFLGALWAPRSVSPALQEGRAKRSLPGGGEVSPGSARVVGRPCPPGRLKAPCARAGARQRPMPKGHPAPFAAYSGDSAKWVLIHRHVRG